MRNSRTITLTAVALCIGALFLADSQPHSLQAASVGRATSPIRASSFEMLANSYGPNGELMREGTCRKMYGWVEDTLVVTNWGSGWRYSWTNMYRQVSCDYETSWENYEGGEVGIAALSPYNDYTNLGVIRADGTENGTFGVDGNTDGGYFQLTSGAWPGCSFLYWEMGTSRWYDGTINLSMSDVNGQTVRAVFQCSS